MRHYILLVSLLSFGCATNKPRVVKMPEVPGRILSTSAAESVRYAENIKRYPIGRYVDPHNPRVMHERHPVYRVESTAKWNLHPNPAVSVPSGPPARVIDSAGKYSLGSQELYLELNRQKNVSEQIIKGSGLISQHLEQLGNQINTLQERRIAPLEQEIEISRKRMEAFEEQLRVNPNPSNPANQTP